MCLWLHFALLSNQDYQPEAGLRGLERCVCVQVLMQLEPYRDWYNSVLESIVY